MQNKILITLLTGANAMRAALPAAAAEAQVIEAKDLLEKQDQIEGRFCYTEQLKGWDHTSQWTESTGGASIKEEDLRGERVEIDGKAVMEQWEVLYMQELAKTAMAPFSAEHGGTILEVGLGLGLSARMIQQQIHEKGSSGNVKHIIFEGCAEVREVQGVKKLWPEVEAKYGAEQAGNLEIRLGMWQDLVATLDDNSIDAVLYDPYPQNEAEQHIHQFLFIEAIFPKLTAKGRLVYCNLTSLGVLRGDYHLPDSVSDLQSWALVWAKKQLPYLSKIGFKDLSYSIFTMPDTERTPGGFPPKECEYYQWNTFLVPVCVKDA